MKLFRRQWIAGALACASLLGAGFAIAQGIKDTKHNLGSLGTGANHVTGTANPTDPRAATGTEEICVFCHTPHGADTSAAAPLWNKRLPAGTGYQVYSTANSSTIDGEVITTVGSVSITCLSCHDGTQAMDNIINAPGSGGFDVTGGGAAGLGYTWTTTGRVDADGRLSPGGIANLGTDLRNDHPIGIEYCGGGLSNTAPNPAAAGPAPVAAGACKDADFNQPRSTTINGQGVWWVDTGGAAGTGFRARNDMILYTRAFTAGAGPSVECASCHDPHVGAGDAGPNSTVAGPTFLRVANTNSAVCLACHNK
ncbi:MAG: hypothetical protein WBA53_16860 [Burkholderiaceae bacterium]